MHRDFLHTRFSRRLSFTGFKLCFCLSPTCSFSAPREPQIAWKWLAEPPPLPPHRPRLRYVSPEPQHGALRVQPAARCGLKLEPGSRFRLQHMPYDKAYKAAIKNTAYTVVRQAAKASVSHRCFPNCKSSSNS